MTILSKLLRLFRPTAPASARAVFVDHEIGIAFPKSIASLTFEGREQYDPPELGYSLRYQGPSLIKADIYVYDKGYRDIPEGAASEAVRAEFAEVIEAIALMEARGAYREVEQLGTQMKSYGQRTREYLWARYGYQQTPGAGVVYEGDRISDTYLSGVRGKFVKIRMTVRKDRLTTLEELSDRFMDQVTRFLEP